MKQRAILFVLTKLILLAILAFCGFGKSFSQSANTPFGYVNPFIGTGGEGHCYPGATVPFGMVQPGPDTRLPDFNKKAFPWCAGYQYRDDTITGFSQTHFSGTGHSDLGDMLIMPFI